MAGRWPSTRSAACMPTSTSPNTHPDTESTGHTGDVAIKHAPAAATTNASNTASQIAKWEGRGLARFLLSRPVSSPRPSNRACGSPAHGLPTFFTVGVRPFRASPGRVWAG